MHEDAEDNGKKHRVDQCVYESVVEFDKAAGGVEYKHDGCGYQDWL